MIQWLSRTLLPSFGLTFFIQDFIVINKTKRSPQEPKGDMDMGQRWIEYGNVIFIYDIDSRQVKGGCYKDESQISQTHSPMQPTGSKSLIGISFSKHTPKTTAVFASSHHCSAATLRSAFWLIKEGWHKKSSIWSIAYLREKKNYQHLWAPELLIQPRLGFTRFLLYQVGQICTSLDRQRLVETTLPLQLPGEKDWPT